MALVQSYDIILDQPQNDTSEPSPSCLTLPERWGVFSFYTTISWSPESLQISACTRQTVCVCDHSWRLWVEGKSSSSAGNQNSSVWLLLLKIWNDAVAFRLVGWCFGGASEFHLLQVYFWVAVPGALLRPVSPAPPSLPPPPPRCKEWPRNVCIGGLHAAHQAQAGSLVSWAPLPSEFSSFACVCVHPV